MHDRASSKSSLGLERQHLYNSGRHTPSQYGFCLHCSGHDIPPTNGTSCCPTAPGTSTLNRFIPFAYTSYSAQLKTSACPPTQIAVTANSIENTADCHAIVDGCTYPLEAAVQVIQLEVDDPGRTHDVDVGCRRHLEHGNIGRSSIFTMLAESAAAARGHWWRTVIEANSADSDVRELVLQAFSTGLLGLSCRAPQPDRTSRRWLKCRIHRC
ncbi:hypothetical protein EI94DRAFT_1782349 [Lactarius quietus]|nr:hypothetical protein EI94DRAFT_1782349 [Lactarius quietus]